MIVASQFVGLNIGRWYVALKGPTNRAYFSERNRFNCRVIPLAFGWRVVIRPRRAA